MSTKRNLAQAALSLEWDDAGLETLVISRQKDFDALFEGYLDMRAISYVSSASLLLDFLDYREFARIELLVGDNVDSRQLKDDLSQKGPSVTERLAAEVEAGRLRVLLPRRTIHSKFYILGRDDNLRLIVTSANLTETARRASGQMNYAWYVDVPASHPVAQRALRDYESHCNGAELFMGDLLDLLGRRRNMARAEIVSLWLGGEGEAGHVGEAKAFVQGLVSQALSHPGEEQQPVIRIELPTAPDTRRHAVRLLAPLGIDGRVRETSISPAKIIRYVEEAHGVPVMRVDVSKQEVWLGFRGSIERLDSEVDSPERVNETLADLEAYIDTVDLGECSDRTFAKTSMYEALLYVLAAPFAHQQMTERRQRYGVVNRRGPRFLYIYGPAQNGKTTFLRYGLKLITDALVDPLTPARFTKAHIRGVQALGTCFPLMFDDMVSTTTRTFEGIVKSHWETDWTDGTPSPQIIFTSNNLNLRDWAKSRLKRVDFDVHFVPTTETQEHLARILEKPNQIFRWFARLYLSKIERPGWLRDDEMATAREVLLGLYERARRPVPRYYPIRPLEDLYDPDLRAWTALMRQRKVTIQREREQTRVLFHDDLERAEVQEYIAALPQTIKTKKIGKTVIVENPNLFHAWLDSGHSGVPLLRRLLRRGK